MRESASPTDLPGFTDGLFYVQDEASQIAVAALDARGASLAVDTCALNPQENEEVCRAFLQENTDFRAVPFSVGSLSSTDGMLTLLPHKHHTDGFFVAKFERM